MSDEIRLHPFAAAILHHLKGKKIEIYSGDIKTIVKFSETDVNQKHVIRGILEDAMGDALIVLVNEKNKYTRVFLNAWSIKSIVAIEDELFVKDIYNEEYEGFASSKPKNSI